MTTSRVLVLCPTDRDRRELIPERSSPPCEALFFGVNPYRELGGFDVDSYVDQAVAIGRDADVDGVMSSDDYPGTTLASVVARRLGLPHVDPVATLLCQHKFHCREAQERLVPEAVPRYGLVDLERPIAPLPFPFFVKPVKSYLSVLAGIVRDEGELDQFVRVAADQIRLFCRPFDQLLRTYSSLKTASAFLLAEELVLGSLVTLEAYVFQGRFHVVAITDSFTFSGTLSFRRFEYPSRLPLEVQERMVAIARRFMLGIGFDNGVFNMEFCYQPASGTISIIEVNPRMCSVFADLMEKVHGTNTYELQVALALGHEPDFVPGGGEFSHAATFVLRTFGDRHVVRVPTPEELQTAAAWFPDARVEVLCRPGYRLSDETQDLETYRCGLVNLGGKNRLDLFDRFSRLMTLLPFELVEPAS